MSALDRTIASAVPLMPRALVRRVASRYIAGERLEDALAVIRNLNRKGCTATVDVLGESTRDKAQAAAILGEYKRVVDALEGEGLAAGLSVKLTALGLDLDEELCRANLEEIVEYAAERGRFVRVDMESSAHTEATIGIVLDAHARHPNVGAVIQAYLRRSIEDVQRLCAAGVSVRLCKGIYDEPRAIAYKDYDTVRQNYVFLLEELMRAGVYVGVATHDEYLVWHALRLVHRLGVPKDRYEFQMLLGVDEELRDILVRAGHRMRVYVPYGRQWYEYSTRRLKENPRVAGYVARDFLERISAAAGRR
ncbi:Proline dehydrogenase 1 [Rubrobacter xylanophilus DSM 9941]|uniref:proline dehydrogenase family protein n=1 Tax=Rubrobacter xylanophilus TaxID=49319 RepID=UPI001C6422F3|nr:proline dehydrogenase family protein [Rubrobacter xylanophilus]QYJ15961.1 Proline dehydrogenase 1 [Rubrobacter xylanophilus DSM 9941]